MVVKEAVSRAGLQPTDIQECIMGNVLGAGLGQNPARQAAIGAGLPVEIGSFTVNAVCGSGMKAAMLAADAIKAQQYEALVVGGMESMSNAPYLMPGARWGYRMNDQTVVDSMVHDGLWDIFNNQHMGFTGEIVAERFNVTREDADRLSMESHLKAAKAAKAAEAEAARKAAAEAKAAEKAKRAAKFAEEAAKQAAEAPAEAPVEEAAAEAETTEAAE